MNWELIVTLISLGVIVYFVIKLIKGRKEDKDIEPLPPGEKPKQAYLQFTSGNKVPLKYLPAWLVNYLVDNGHAVIINE